MLYATSISILTTGSPTLTGTMVTVITVFGTVIRIGSDCLGFCVLTKSFFYFYTM